MPKKQKLHCLNFCFHAALGRFHHPAAHFQDIKNGFFSAELALCLYMTSGVAEDHKRIVMAVRTLYHSGFLIGNRLSGPLNLNLHFG